MSNKNMILQNNAQLLLHKQDILDLPTIAEIAAEASTGKYAWKKLLKTLSVVAKETVSEIPTSYKYRDESGTINVYYSSEYVKDDENGSYSLSNPSFCEVSVVNSYTLKDGKFFIIGSPTGTTMYKASSSSNVNYGTTIGVTHISSNASYPTKKYEFDFETVTDENVVGIVVDNSPLAYTDGGAQDGYWYERIQEKQLGDFGIDYGTVTLGTSSSDPITVNHSLGVTPTHAFLCPIFRVPFNGSWINVDGRAVTGGGSSLNLNEASGYIYVTNTRITKELNQIQFLPYSSSYKWRAGTYIWFAIA